MKKIEVEICVGTTCYIMGASQLQQLEEFLPDEWRDHVEIIGGPLRGLPAVILRASNDRDRVAILLSVLQDTIPANISRSQLRRVD